MQKIYRMLVVNERTQERKTYLSPHQGSAPSGWKCAGVLGYFEKTKSSDQVSETESRRQE